VVMKEDSKSESITRLVVLGIIGLLLLGCLLLRPGQYCEPRRAQGQEPTPIDTATPADTPMPTETPAGCHH